MPDDAAPISTLATYLRRSLARETKTVADIEALSLAAFAACQDGTTAVEVTFEGGSTRSLVNCMPHVLLAACETVLAEQDTGNELANTSERHKYGDFSGGRIES